MKYVIIGGDAAGMSAAMQIIKYDRNADIITLERGSIYSYAQCGLPYVINKQVPKTEDLIARSLDTFRDKFGIDAKICHEVQAVDVKSKSVKGMNKQTNEAFHMNYDKLLIASGGDPFIPDWAGIKLKGIHVLKTIPDAKAIIKDLQNGVQDVTVIGGGYIGLEMAESFRSLGLAVRIINRGKQVAKIFDEDMAAYIHEEAKKQGIEIIFEENVQSIHGEEFVKSIRTDKNEYQTDLVLIATGIRPNTAFLNGSGVETSVKGAIKVNQYMETNIKDVYAAGDCAVQYHLVKQQDDYIPLGTNANKQGRIAGMNMVGLQRPYRGMTGTSILKFMNLTLGKTGLSETEARSLRLNYASAVVTTKDIAGYYPGAKNLHVKLVYDLETKRLLGGQVIGENGVAKRIDVLATALFNHMTIEDLEDLDLSYAPPYNGVWDPIQRAARKAK
ncbi:FAD-dependent oxidoreductase [Bacillus sp. FJAT-50079]|uniref:FAD-dependent oxidoreductase n=1 Tax=Bacillus sp. FJAT-50079 TaxID=2833577 RepID=UPI001BC9CBB8|nr:FAD-dependent oxidoreductase [Bacillus sp. FJAT-50079]MBS4210420.1 FAD-dependent oxidoreductase [Bacillus sp. FJAT-50079]